jgi:hypothetical protein
LTYWAIPELDSMMGVQLKLGHYLSKAAIDRVQVSTIEPQGKVDSAELHDVVEDPNVKRSK